MMHRPPTWPELFRLWFEEIAQMGIEGAMLVFFVCAFISFATVVIHG